MLSKIERLMMFNSIVHVKLNAVKETYKLAAVTDIRTSDIR